MEIWIGLVNVAPMPGNNDLKGAKGAYVNVIAPATNRNEFDFFVKTELTALRFEVLSIEDVEPVADRIRHHSIDPELYSQVGIVQKTGKVGLGTFHAYEEDESLH